MFSPPFACPALLWVDDELLPDSPSVQLLSGSGFPVQIAHTGIDALSAIRSRIFSGIILDLSLPDIDGLNILSELRAARSKVPVVILTGHATVQVAVHAIRLGAMDVCEKPLIGEDLLALARRLIHVSPYDLSGSVRRLHEALRLAGPSDFQRILAASLVDDSDGWCARTFAVTRLKHAMAAPRDVILQTLAAEVVEFENANPLGRDLCFAFEHSPSPDFTSTMEMVRSAHSVTRRDYRAAVIKALRYSWPQILRRLRLRNCLRTLGQQRDHVRQAAFASGYSHASELNRDCRTLLGTTPSAFRAAISDSPSPLR